jgi:predicted Zn-dependent protease
MRAERWSDALPEIERLRADDPDRVSFRVAEAEIRFHLGETGAALELYEETLSLFPYDEMATHLYAETLVRLGRHEKAADLLETYQTKREPMARTYETLSKAYNGLGRKLAANAALAEQHYLQGDINAAIHQLGIALREETRESDYAVARAEARLSELQDERALREKK